MYTVHNFFLFLLPITLVVVVVVVSNIPIRWGPSGDVFKSIHRFVCVLCTHIFQFAYTASALHHEGHTFAISLLCEKIISTGKQQKRKMKWIGESVAAERMKYYGTCEIQLSPDLKP